VHLEGKLPDGKVFVASLDEEIDFTLGKGLCGSVWGSFSQSNVTNYICMQSLIDIINTRNSGDGKRSGNGSGDDVHRRAGVSKVRYSVWLLFDK